MRKKAKTEPTNETNSEAVPSAESNGKQSIWEKALEEAKVRSEKIRFTNELISRIMKDRAIASDDKLDVIDQELVSDGRFNDQEIAYITEPKVNDFNGSTYYGYGKLEEIKADQLVKQREKQLERRNGGAASHVESITPPAEGQSEGNSLV